jgi:hypothetical protein
MKTIYKFALSRLESCPVVDMPCGAQILDVQVQNDKICLWAIVESTEKFEARKFFVVGTGHPLPPNAGAHIGTVQSKGPFVWHVFEERSGSTPHW